MRHTFENYCFRNQLINGTNVNSIIVKVFNPRGFVVPSKTLVATDGHTKNPSAKRIYNYNYVIESSDIKQKNNSANNLYLYINIYISKKFNIDKLDTLDNFAGKEFLFKALNRYNAERSLTKRLGNGFVRKLEIGGAHLNNPNIYDHLISLVRTGKVDKATELLQECNISACFTLPFWENLYWEIHLVQDEDWSSEQLSKLHKNLEKFGFMEQLEQAPVADIKTSYNRLIELIKTGQPGPALSLLDTFNLPLATQAIFWRELYRCTTFSI